MDINQYFPFILHTNCWKLSFQGFGCSYSSGLIWQNLPGSGCIIGRVYSKTSMYNRFLQEERNERFLHKKSFKQLEKLSDASKTCKNIKKPKILTVKQFLAKNNVTTYKKQSTSQNIVSILQNLFRGKKGHPYCKSLIVIKRMAFNKIHRT